MHSIDLPSLRKPPMRKFECSICHARFVRPTPAYNHMVRVHNIRPEPEVQDLFDLTTLSVDHPDIAGSEVGTRGKRVSGKGGKGVMDGGNGRVGYMYIDVMNDFCGILASLTDRRQL